MNHFPVLKSRMQASRLARAALFGWMMHVYPFAETSEQICLSLEANEYSGGVGTALGRGCTMCYHWILRGDLAIESGPTPGGDVWLRLSITTK